MKDSGATKPMIYGSSREIDCDYDWRFGWLAVAVRISS